MFNPRFYKEQGHSQKETTLKWLEARGLVGVNSFEGYKVGMPRLAARINDLRKDGYNIKSIQLKKNEVKYILLEDLPNIELPD